MTEEENWATPSISEEAKTHIVDYETIELKDEELKYRRLTEQQERHIDRLEKLIESLQEENERLRSGERIELNSPITDPSTHTLPQGIQLPSVMRQELESKLREKALLKAESK